MNLDDMKTKRPVDQERVDGLKEEMQDTAEVSPTGYTNDTVTITISRETAEDFAERAGQWAVVSKPFADACRAALEGER